MGGSPPFMQAPVKPTSSDHDRPAPWASDQGPRCGKAHIGIRIAGLCMSAKHSQQTLSKLYDEDPVVGGEHE